MKQERKIFICGDKSDTKVAPEKRHAKSVLVLFVDDYNNDSCINSVTTTFTCKGCYIVEAESSANYSKYFKTSQAATNDGLKITISIIGDDMCLVCPKVSSKQATK